MSSGRARAVEEDDACRNVSRFGEDLVERRAAAGARPMPPATKTTSFPSAAATGQFVPNGPRTPRCRPSSARSIALRHRADRAGRVDERLRHARVAADGDRHLADAEDVEHVELPRANANPACPASGRSSSVKVSLVSFVTRAPDRASGTSGRERTRRRSFAADPLRGHVVVEVEELQAGHVEPLGHDLGEALQELVAELVVLLALRPQALAVERDGADEIGRVPVEVPAVGRERATTSP